MRHPKRTTAALSVVRAGRVMLAGCLLLGSLGFAATPSAVASGPALATPSFCRTIVAHELTNYRHQRYDDYYDPVISGDGSRIVYYTFDRPNGHEYLYLADFDGSNAQVLKERINGARSYYGIGISDDGGRIVMLENDVVWIFQPGITAPLSYLPFGEAIGLNSLILDGDGNRVYFVIASDRALSGGTVLRGVYRMNYDGTGVQRIISPEDLALASGEDIAAFDTLNIGLSASQDGSHLAVAALDGRDGHRWLFAYDGQLRLLRPKGSYSGWMVSADGAVLVANGGYDDQNTYVMRWGGAEIRVLPGEANCSHALQITGDGARFLMDCQASPMVDVDTESRELYLARGSSPVPLYSLMAASMVNASMSRDGKRFVFNTNDANNYNQIATAEVDPADLGAAPQITSPALDPPFLRSQYGSVATLSFDASLPANTGMNIGTGISYEGQDVLTISTPSWNEEEPGGVYTSNIAATGARPGFYTYRIVADIMAPDSRRHATAVYFGPLTVDAAPSVGVAINHTTGKPGSYLAVSGTGFPPGRPATVAVNGAILSSSLTVNEDGKLVFYLNTDRAQPGEYLVSICANTAARGLQSVCASVRFTLVADGPERPLAGIRPVFVVPAGLELHELSLPLVLRGG